jgi:hypothetical protein
VAEAVSNVYILGGGVNQWIDTFADTEFKAEHPLLAGAGTDALKFSFSTALGSRYAVADPNPEKFKLKFEPKVKLDIARGAKAGGCG